MDIKQVIVIRKDLGMRKGKFVSQGAHASMAVFTKKGIVQDIDGEKVFCFPVDENEIAWLTGNFKKICVSVDSEVELLSIHEQAIKNGLPSSLIMDSGLTEFGGVATYTAVAIGPANSEKIDQITGELKLL